MDSNKLDKYKNKIDLIDATLAKLLSKRMRLVAKIARKKERYDIDSAPVNWNKALERVKRISGAENEAEQKLIEDIWNRIHEEELKLEKLS